MDPCPRDERLDAWLDGELPEADALALEAHVAACTRCADETAGLRELGEMARGLPVPEVADAEWAAAWDGIAARIAPEPRRSGLWTAVHRLRYILVPAAAAALIALAIGFLSLGPYNVAEAEEIVVESVEPADGYTYTSSYYHSDEAQITIITLVPVDDDEAPPSDDSHDPP